MNCSVTNCTNEAKAGTLCWAHAKRKQKGLPLDTPLRGRGPKPEAVPCSTEGCGKPVKASGLCNTHYQAFLDGREIVAPVRREKPDPGVAIARSVPEDLADAPQKPAVRSHTTKKESRTMSEFSVGQCVKFKSGGPEMTVISVGDDEVVVGWFNNTAAKAEDPPTWTLEQQELPAEVLIASEDADE